jgi:hypothetical protein
MIFLLKMFFVFIYYVHNNDPPSPFLYNPPSRTCVLRYQICINSYVNNGSYVGTASSKNTDMCSRKKSLHHKELRFYV